MKAILPRRISLAGLTAVGAVLGCAASCSPSGAVGGEPAVAPPGRDPGEIWEAINKAKPGQVVRVQPGTYAPLKLNGLKFSTEVTVTSADPQRPSVLRGLNITDSQGLVFKGLEVSVNPATGFAVMLGGDAGIRFEEMDLHGSAVGDGNAVMVRNSSKVTVTKSRIHDLANGINHLNSDQITFSDNDLHDIQADGIRGGGSSNVMISGNHFTDFYPKDGDHPDAIQFWTMNTSAATHDLTITNNVYVRGKGQQIQGIFVGNEEKIPFQNVTITGNAIVGGMYHGISIGYADHATIANNLVQGYADMTSWIMLNHTTNSTAEDNQATTYQLDDGNAGLVARRNKDLRAVRVGDDTVLKAWAKPAAGP